MNRAAKQRVYDAIHNLPEGDIKVLQGLEGSFRLRTGNCRVVFSWAEKDVIYIEKIGSRGDIYKGGVNDANS